jgi:sugar lactone lactonase YvrE
MVRRAARLLLLPALITALVVAGRPAAATAQPSIQTLTIPGGQPDDITVDPRGRLLWGNLSRGTIERLQGRKVVTVLRRISVPEGIVARPGGIFFVAEQGTDRVLRIAGGRRTVVHQLAPVPGQEGVDGIGWDPHSHTLLIPDSPRGTVLRLIPSTGKTQVLARGLGRPVDAAIDRKGNILVPDEHLGTLAVISPRGRVSYRGRFNTPDDVSIDGSGRIWVTSLGDNSLWVLLPDGTQRVMAGGLSNPQGLTLDRCGDPIVVEQGVARIVRLLLTGHSHACQF